MTYALILAMFFSVPHDTLELKNDIYEIVFEDLEGISEKTISIEKLKNKYLEKGYDSVLVDLNEIMNECSPKEYPLLALIKARLFYEKGLTEKSITQYEDILSYFEDYPFYKINTEAIIANLYIEKHDYQKSASILVKWLEKYADKIRKNQLKSYIHNLGICYLHLHKFDSAEIYLSKSINIKKLLHDTLGLAISYMDFANLYYEQYLDDKAIPLFIKGLEYAKLGNDQKVLRNAYLNMAVVEENRNDFKKALEYRKEYEKVVKELWDRDKVWELAEQEKQFEVSLKEKEISLLEEQRKVQQTELAAEKQQRNYLVGISVLLLITAIGSVLGYRKIKLSNELISSQKNELAEMNQHKNQLFSIVAHDLKSPVFALQKANKKLSSAIEDQDEVKVKSILSENEKIAGNTYSLLNNLLQWALDQSDQVMIQPETIPASRLIEQVVFDYLGPIQDKHIDLTENVNREHVIYADISSVKIILRNVIDNAIKFTPSEGKISIHSEQTEKEVIITISDTGCGLQMANANKYEIQSDTYGKKGTGLGLTLAQSMAKRNHGNLSLFSQIGKGTQATLILPSQPTA